MTEQSNGDRRASKSSPPTGRRRDKAQLSCMLCRHRKLRCDRSQPCQNCSKRGQSCVYVNAANNNAHGKPGPSAKQYPAYLNGLHDRIRHLEAIVLNLVGPRASVADSSDPQDEPHIAESVERLSIDDDGSSYFGSSTWQAILDEIGYMKDLIPESQENPFSARDDVDHGGLDLLLGSRVYVDTSELYDAIPPQSDVEPLVEFFFHNMELSPLIVHSPTFRKEYEAFLIDPTGVSPIWIAMLFAMLSLASNFRLLSGVDRGEEAALRVAVKSYREKCAQCLILGDYTKPSKHSLPAMLLYLSCERLRREEYDIGLPMLFSMIVSLAMRMGYHRDPRHYPNLSPFEAEMHRRLWTVLIQFDLIISVGVGLPRIINENHADNTPPHNFLEEDISEDLTELPHPRPAAEPTLVTYVIARMRMIKMLGRITDLVHNAAKTPYDTILEVDRDLYSLYQQLPTFCKVGEGPEINDPMTFLQRLSFESLYEQARCTLHRKYLTVPDPRYAYSRGVCVDAALRMLAQQRLMHEESQPNRILYKQRWKLLTYLNRENLLATMIVGLDVEHSLRRRAAQNYYPPVGDAALETKLEALEHSHAIWEEYRSISKEAATAATALAIILAKAKEVFGPLPITDGTVMPGMSNCTSPMHSLQGDQYTVSPIECLPPPSSATAGPAVATALPTQYMLGVETNGGVLNEMSAGGQPQFQYDPNPMYPPPTMMPPETSRASLSPMSSGISPPHAYKVMESMIDQPMNLGWCALWESQYPGNGDYPRPVPTEDELWELNGNTANSNANCNSVNATSSVVFPPPAVGPPFHSSGAAGYLA
ncbi:hypothetical protein LOZ51_000144 [Ophidiomyces ophidiicola]|nr:hypothetical protein LOZ51_000144 [Ophidiomyces ophidiicola]